MNKIQGWEYIGELPKVYVQAPIIKTSGRSAKCTGCGNIGHYLDLETAICAYCVSKEITKDK